MSKQLSATLKNEVKELLEKVAKEKGVSESAIVSIALTEYFRSDQLKIIEELKMSKSGTSTRILSKDLLNTVDE